MMRLSCCAQKGAGDFIGGMKFCPTDLSKVYTGSGDGTLSLRSFEHCTSTVLSTTKDCSHDYHDVWWALRSNAKAVCLCYKYFHTFSVFPDWCVLWQPFSVKTWQRLPFQLLVLLCRRVCQQTDAGDWGQCWTVVITESGRPKSKEPQNKIYACYNKYVYVLL